MKPFVRSAYNYDMHAASSKLGTVNTEPSKTVQADAADVNINIIVARFGVSGIVPATTRPPLNMDFEDIFDFQSAHNAIIDANRAFAEQPSSIRNRFNNDVSAFVDFCSDEKNIDELRKLGLASPAPAAIIPPEPTLVRIVPDPPTKGST